MAPVGVLFSMLMCYNECILRLMVQWNWASLQSWTYLILFSLCHVLGLCHFFLRLCPAPFPLVRLSFLFNEQGIIYPSIVNPCVLVQQCCESLSYTGSSFTSCCNIISGHIPNREIAVLSQRKFTVTLLDLEKQLSKGMYQFILLAAVNGSSYFLLCPQIIGFI